MTKVLMAGVDQSTKGGMWSVAENYLEDSQFRDAVKLRYIPTACAGGALKKAACFALGLARVLAAMLVNRPDVVHLHVSERGSVKRKAVVSRLARLFRCKVLLHLHGAEFESWYTSLNDRGQRRVRRFLNKADGILILGEYWRGFISGLTEDKDKIRVLYNAVAVPAENPYRPEAENLLFLGEVGERKGVYDLLQAMQKISGRLPEQTRLQLYGPNPDGDIQERIRQLGLDARVQYCGWADGVKKEAAFASAAVNLLPSYHEGLPMTILESMARGVPCITTEIAAIPEAVDSRCGVLVQPGDVQGLAAAIDGLITDQAARQSMSKWAYLRAQERFSLENHRNSLLRIYAELTEKQK